MLKWVQEWLRTVPRPSVSLRPPAHLQRHTRSFNVVWALVVGLITGWLAGQVVKGTGFGLVADIAIGIVGALIGGWLLPRLGIHLGSGIVPAIIGATIGAIILLLILRLVYRRERW